MRIDRVKINGKSYYYVDGESIRFGALATMISGIYGADVYSKFYDDTRTQGTVIIEQYLGDGSERLAAQLEKANKKIAALEKKVAQLTIRNLYQDT